MCAFTISGPPSITVVHSELSWLRFRPDTQPERASPMACVAAHSAFSPAARAQGSGRARAAAPGTIARAVQPPVHDVTDVSVLRSWLNSPLGASLDADIFKVPAACQGCSGLPLCTDCMVARAAGSVRGGDRACAAAEQRAGLDLSARARAGSQNSRHSGTHAPRRPQATNVIRTFAKAHLMSPDRAIPPAVLRDAAGFAILTVVKARPRPALRGMRREWRGLAASCEQGVSQTSSAGWCCMQGEDLACCLTRVRACIHTSVRDGGCGTATQDPGTPPRRAGPCRAPRAAWAGA